MSDDVNIDYKPHMHILFSFEGSLYHKQLFLKGTTIHYIGD